MNAPDLNRLSLGAYVLGALDGGERGELEAHLVTCPACQEELVQLAGLPDMLRQLTLEEAEAMPHLDPQERAGEFSTQALADRALADLRRQRSLHRGRTRVALLAVAASVAAILVTGSFATGVIGDGWFASGASVTATDAATHVRATFRMKEEQAGTELKLRLSGVPEKQRCMMVAIANDGTRETAATWLASYAGEADLEGYTSIPPYAMAALEITTPEGKTLLHVNV